MLMNVLPYSPSPPLLISPTLHPEPVLHRRQCHHLALQASVFQLHLQAHQ